MATSRTEVPSHAGTNMEGKLGKPLCFWKVIITKVSCIGEERIKMRYVSKYHNSLSFRSLLYISP